MTDQPFNWRDDATGCYGVWAAAKREQGIRAGLIEPQTPLERKWAAEGPVPPPLLHAGKHAQEAS